MSCRSQFGLRRWKRKDRLRQAPHQVRWKLSQQHGRCMNGMMHVGIDATDGTVCTSPETISWVIQYPLSESACLKTSSCSDASPPPSKALDFRKSDSAANAFACCLITTITTVVPCVFTISKYSSIKAFHCSHDNVTCHSLEYLVGLQRRRQVYH
jgi:hypothetical protein